jgi:TPR repeat protein
LLFLFSFGQDAFAQRQRRKNPVSSNNTVEEASGLAKHENNKQEPHANSPVYKDYKEPDSTSLFKRTNDSYELYKSYDLIKEANQGNPRAQHELAVRYLLGQGFPCDTLKSLYWTKKAADLGLPEARYNLGIFLNNGWGIEWNPFKAYEQFKIAAESKMPDAQYVLGLMYLDNLVVPRDYRKAFLNIRDAAKKGYKLAIDILQEIVKNPVEFGLDSAEIRSVKLEERKPVSVSAVNPALGVNYMDFRPDSLSKTDDITLLKEVLREGSDELKFALGKVVVRDTSLVADISIIKTIQEAAENGSPEAQTLLGRCYEKGIGLKKDLLQAAVQYIRAVRLDSRRAPKLLLVLLSRPEFYKQLNAMINAKRAGAYFIYAGLVALHYNSQVTEPEALRMLEAASEVKYVPAIIEMGLCYYTGNMTRQDKNKAITIWKQAAELGSSEARVRIAIANVQEHFIYQDSTESIKVLREAAEAGSLLAEMALAYCYETGTGIQQDRLNALHLYKVCTQRGSQGAYRALKRLYDGIRPDKKEFVVFDNDK